MVFCPKCGAENKEGARFCLKCGTALAPIERDMAPPTIPQAKSVVIAIILNLIWGLGYYYLGIKKVGNAPWFFLTIFSVLLWIVNMMLYRLAQYGVEGLIMGYFLSIYMVAGFICMAIDIYQKGKGRPGLIPSLRGKMKK